MVLTGIRKMELREVPNPEIVANDDVLIKLERVGVCGSDVHYYTTGHIGDLVVKYPFAVGHECAGIVVEVGRRVKNLHEGDRVAVDPAKSCGECSQCRMGRIHTCLDLKFLGCPGQAEGSLSDYIVMPAASCFRLRPPTSPELGVLSEPLSIGVYACELASGLGGANIGILGSGPIGLSVLLAALHGGAHKAYVTDKLEYRLKLARRLGAQWTGNPLSMDIGSRIAGEEPQLLDLVFECCGRQEAVDQALEILKPGGKLLMIGIPETERVSFPMDTMRRKEICIQNVRRQRGCTRRALDLIEDGFVVAAPMITHHFPLERTKEAFDLVTGYEDGVVKAMITLD